MWPVTASERSAAESSARLGLRWERLRRSGAIHSSRSAMSRQDGVYDDDEIVGVGQGKSATFVEHVLARLEQHGLRRCMCSEDEALPRAIAPVCAAEEVAAGTGDESLGSTQTARTRGAAAACEGDVGGDDTPDTERAPYYYLCVPCELRLTAVTTRAATRAMLQDVHDHFASAAHRRLASWMADPDINVTLQSSPLIAQPAGYVRVYVNGVPVLLSRRPGGGDMFYALPHEEAQLGAHHGKQTQRPQEQREAGASDALMHVDGDVSAGGSPASHTTRLFPCRTYAGTGGSRSSAAEVYWYHPLRSLFTRSKQHVNLQPSHTAVRHSAARARRLEHRPSRAIAVRRALSVQHVPLVTYLDETLLHKDKVPVWPVLLPLYKRRRRKAGGPRDGHALRLSPGHMNGSRGDVDGCRVVYVEGLQSAIATYPTMTTGSGGGGEVWPGVDRCVVEAEAAYRVVLVSSEQQGQLASLPPQTEQRREQARHVTVTPVTLTRALLSQVATERPRRNYEDDDDDDSDTTSSCSAPSQTRSTRSSLSTRFSSASL